MKAQNKQSIFDLSGQYFGDLNHIVSLAVGNDLTLNQEIPINQELIIDNPVGVGNDKNKEAIVVQGLSFNNDAISIYDYDFGRWCLPSKDELNQMYLNLKVYGVGGFAITNYWSSSELDFGSAWLQSFSTGFQGTAGKGVTNVVRACRSFTAAIGAYSLRDVGPSGGLIFYISGTTFYEAAAADQSAGKAWSNITNVLIGTTGTAIGTEEGNTAAIIGQSGHTTSAAKLCDDLN